MEKFKMFIKNYNEWLSLPIAIVVYFAAPGLYRLADPTAGQFDAGYLHALIFAVVAINFSSGISWLMLKLNFPKLYKFWDDDFEDLLMEGNGDNVGDKAVLYSYLIYISYFVAMMVFIVAVI
jgi:hypothetical protein